VFLPCKGMSKNITDINVINFVKVGIKLLSNDMVARIDNGLSKTL
jgi:hypothetical protein